MVREVGDSDPLRCSCDGAHPSSDEALRDAEGLFDTVARSFEGTPSKKRCVKVARKNKPPSPAPKGAIRPPPPPPPPRPQALAEPQSVMVPDELPLIDTGMEEILLTSGEAKRRLDSESRHARRLSIDLAAANREALGLRKMFAEERGNATYWKSMYESLSEKRSLWTRLISSLTKD